MQNRVSYVICIVIPNEALVMFFKTKYDTFHLVNNLESYGDLQ